MKMVSLRRGLTEKIIHKINGVSAHEKDIK